VAIDTAKGAEFIAYMSVGPIERPGRTASVKWSRSLTPEPRRRESDVHPSFERLA